MPLDPNGKYLRQVTTGEIYGFDPEFAKRSDMVPYRPGQDMSDVEVVTIDTRKPAGALEAVASTPDGFKGGGVMGAILGED
jgi:hypothetical protein